MQRDSLIFVDIDTQVDFLDSAGRLYVPGAEAIVPHLERLFVLAARERIPVFSSVDLHTPDDPEFQDWPPHCVGGTIGQEKIAATLLPSRLVLEPDNPAPGELLGLMDSYNQLIFPKAGLDAFDNPHFTRMVEALPEAEYVVFGVATDYCVLLAARGLLQRHRRVKIVRDAVRGIAPETEARACRELSAMGAEWVTTDAIEERYRRSALSNQPGSSVSGVS